MIWSSAATIEAEGGEWSCRFEGAAVDDQGAESGWCEGAGGFEGLRAFVVFDVHDASGVVFGYITNGQGPPAPEPAP